VENSEKAPDSFDMRRREHRYRKHQEAMKEMERGEIEKNAEAIAQLTYHCTALGCQLTSDNFSYRLISGVTANSPGIVQLLHPELVADDDGLYNLRALQEIQQALPAPHRVGFAPGHVQTSKGILFAHPFFRREFHKNGDWGSVFMDLFWRLQDQAIERLVALDQDRIKVDFSEPGFLFDTWVGVGFKQDIATIPDAIVQLRPSPEFDEDHLLFNGIYSLDIAWNTSKGIKTFYAEEFMNESVLIDYEGTTYFPARYIHAEFDLATGYFRHFDGAMHFYDIEEYMARRDSDLNYNRKNLNQIKTKSKKLFRLDGKISVEIWMKLTTNFLSQDPLIIEYFTGKYPEPLEGMRQYLRGKLPE
jgi:hypothetical protein